MHVDLTKSYKLFVTEEELETMIAVLQFAVVKMGPLDAVKYFGDRGIVSTDGVHTTLAMLKRIVEATGSNRLDDVPERSYSD